MSSKTVQFKHHTHSHTHPVPNPGGLPVHEQVKHSHVHKDEFNHHHSYLEEPLPYQPVEGEESVS